MKKEYRGLALAFVRFLVAWINVFSVWIMLSSTPVWVGAWLLDYDRVGDTVYYCLSLPSLFALVITDLIMKCLPESEA